MKSVIEQARNYLLSISWLRRLGAFLLHPKLLVGANIIAFDKSKRVLLAQHSWKERYQWRTPGGLVERNEDVGKALIREMKEELGLNIKSKDLVLVDIRINKDFPRVDVYYLYLKKVFVNIIPNSEIKRIKFFKVSNLPQSLFPGQAEVIRKSADLFVTKN